MGRLIQIYPKSPLTERNVDDLDRSQDMTHHINTSHATLLSFFIYPVSKIPHSRAVLFPPVHEEAINTLQSRPARVGPRISCHDETQSRLYECLCK